MDKRVFKQRCMEYALTPDTQGQGEEYLTQKLGRLYRTYEMAKEHLAEGDSVLSVGAGAGYIEAMLAAELDIDIYIADFPATIELRSRQYESAGFQTIECDLTDPSPLPSDLTFDLILSCEVMEHLPQSPSKQIDTLTDSLARDGSLLITTPNLARVRNIAKLIAGHSYLPDPQRYFSEVSYENEGVHRREYTISELQSAAQSNGLSIFESGYMVEGTGQRPIVMLLYPIERVIPRFRPIMYIVAKP